MSGENIREDNLLQKLWKKKWIKNISKISLTLMVAMLLLNTVGISPSKAIDGLLGNYIPAYADYIKERDKLNIKIDGIAFYEKQYSKREGIVSPHGIFQPSGDNSIYSTYKPNIKITLKNRNKVKSVYSFYSTTDNDDTLLKEKTKLNKFSTNKYTLDMNYSHGYNDDEGSKILYLIFVGELGDMEGYYCELDNASISNKAYGKLKVKNLVSEKVLEKMTTGEQGFDLSISLNKAEILDMIKQMKNQID